MDNNSTIITEQINTDTSTTSNETTSNIDTNKQPTTNLLNNNLVEQEPLQDKAVEEEVDVLEENSEEPKVEKKEETRISARFAALARREKQLLEREKAIKDYEVKSKSLSKAIENIKKDPMSALQEVGLTFEELAQAYLNGQNPDYEPTPEEKIKQIEERLAQREQQEKEAVERAEQEKLEKEQKRIEESISNYKANLKRQIDNEGDKYELIRANEAYDMVYDVIETYYKDNQQVLEPAVAMEHVEQYLEEQARKLLNLKKFAPKSTEQAEEVKDNSPDVRVSTPSPTLTNKQFTATTATAKPEGLSREESLRRAAALIKWNN